MSEREKIKKIFDKVKRWGIGTKIDFLLDYVLKMELARMNAEKAVQLLLQKQSHVPSFMKDVAIGQCAKCGGNLASCQGKCDEPLTMIDFQAPIMCGVDNNTGSPVRPNPKQPAWQPEVGGLYRSYNGKIWEYIDHFTMIDRDGYSVTYGSIDEIRHYQPASELEGFQVGDKVYSIEGNNIVEWNISSIHAGLMFVEYGCCQYQITIDGFITLAGEQKKQLFWRTKERALKFGKGK